MRRTLGLALVLAAAVAAPAGAAVPEPRYLDFENQPVGTETPGVYAGDNAVTFLDGDSGCGQIVEPGGKFGPRYLDGACPLTLVFRTGQAVVDVYAKVRRFPGNEGQLALDVTAFNSSGTPVDSEHSVPASDVWSPVVLTDPGATITRVVVDSTNGSLGVDDVGFSGTPQPDVDITDGPAGTASSGDATFTFAGNQPNMTFTCSLDGGPAEACGSPKSYSGLGEGQHTFTVTGRDRWGTDDPSPPGRTWTVDAVADRDGDGVLDGGDNCPDTANAAQGDADRDGVGDACEVLPSGNTPLVAGRFAKVKLLSGDVFVKLAPGAAGSAFTSGLRVPFQDSGFLPLKGVAAVPMGSTLDTRRGAVALTAAINGQPARSRRQLRREARFRAGIFAIRQARRARRAKRSKRIPPRAELASPAGAEVPCRASGPPKGVRVRSLSMTAKGVFRAVGGASTATPAKGTSTFITTDRCDGTVTEVGRGRVAVIAKRTGKRRVVRAGRAYIVRARLFAARKGRRG